MLNIKYIKKIEKETEKRLKKNYRESAFFVIDKITFNISDCEDIVEIEARAGYSYMRDDKETYEQVRMVFSPSLSVIKNSGEFAVMFFHYAVSKLDDFSYFKED